MLSTLCAHWSGYPWSILSRSSYQGNNLFLLFVVDMYASFNNQLLCIAALFFSRSSISRGYLIYPTLCPSWTWLPSLTSRLVRWRTGVSSLFERMLSCWMSTQPTTGNAKLPPPSFMRSLIRYFISLSC